MMFVLPDVRQKDTGLKQYLSLIDLRFPRVQEERHFQSYYFYKTVNQIRLLCALLTAVLFLGTMVDYLSPLDIQNLPYFDQDNINHVDLIESKSEQRNQFIIRMITIGILLAFLIFTFTSAYKRLWKLYTSAISFIATVITIIFVHDFRTIPQRMIVLLVCISISSGLTLIPAIISSLLLFIFYVLYYLLYIDVTWRPLLLLSLIILISGIFLMFIARKRELLIREKYRNLESLKLQSIRSQKIINQMLPAVVVERLRQERKEKSLLKEMDSYVSNSSDTNITIENDSSSSNNNSNIDNSKDTSITMTNLNQSAEQLIVDSYNQVTVLFCEIVNFNALIDKMTPVAVITLLNEVYNSFDRLTDVYGVTKVEHIGNVYMVVGGCPNECPDHANRVAHMSLGMLSVIRRYGIVQVRIGMHTGDVVGGIIGKKKLSWHLFGDTINTASRMASHSTVGRIQVSAPVHALLKKFFLFEDRGKIAVKGKGQMRTFFLIKTKALDKRYTSIFSSLNIDKAYIPPVDISEVAYEKPEDLPQTPRNNSIGGGNQPSIPTSPSVQNLASLPNRTSTELLKRERKGSIFASVAPKVLNFFSPSGEPNTETAISSTPKTKVGFLDLQNLNASPTTINVSNNNNSKDPIDSPKKKIGFVTPQSSLSKGTGRDLRSGSPVPFDGSGVDDEEETNPNTPNSSALTGDQDLGKGISGSNVIQSNNIQLSKLESDSKEHYQLGHPPFLRFISENNHVEREFKKEFVITIYWRVITSMLFVTFLLALGAVSDYIFLKRSAFTNIVNSSEEGSSVGWDKRDTENAIYDIITGVRFAIAFIGLIFTYAISKFKHFPHLFKTIEYIAAGYFIFMAAMIVILSSIPPLNTLPIEGIMNSLIMVIITLSYNYSGIRFWLSTIVALACLFFFELSLAWKHTNSELALSHNYYLITVLIINILTSFSEELYTRQNWVHRQLTEKEQRESEAIVREILPRNVIDQMKGIDAKGGNAAASSSLVASRQLIADVFDNVTIFLSDIVGFTEMAAKLTPRQLVETLNQVYSTFDAIAQENQVLKVATIGDAYLCVCGCPERQPDHAERVAKMALSMLEAIKSIRTPDGSPIRMRIGIHSGPVIAGVVGIKMIHYQLWGDSCTIAQQMESGGKADQIHVSESTYNLLSHKYIFEERPEGTIKKRNFKTYFLTRERVPSDPPPPQESSYRPRAQSIINRDDILQNPNSPGGTTSSFNQFSTILEEDENEIDLNKSNNNNNIFKGGLVEEDDEEIQIEENNHIDEEEEDSTNSEIVDIMKQQSE